MVSKTMHLVFFYFKYVFYRAYLWQGKIQGTEFRRVGVAWAYVAILISLYVFAMAALISYVFKTPLLFSLNKLGAVIFAGVFSLVVYLIPNVMLFHAGRYKRIVEEVGALHETKLQAQVRAFLLFMNYIILFILTTLFAALPNLIH